MGNEEIVSKLEALKKSVDTLVLIELCKAGATRDQARETLGGISNESFAKINKVFGRTKK